MIPNWQRWAVVIAVVGLVFNAYLVGKKQGQQDTKLAQNETLIKKNDSTLNKQSEQLKKSDKQDSILVAYHSKVREKVVVRLDTIIVHPAMNDSTPNEQIVVSPEIAQLIQADDSTIAALQRSLALRDTLIASLHRSVELRDQRIHILEAEAKPGKLKRILAAARPFAIGAIVGAAFVASR